VSATTETVPQAARRLGVDYHQLRRVLRAAGIVRVNDGHKGSTRTVLAVGVADRLAVGLRGAK
jgi:hypothetical protein